MTLDNRASVNPDGVVDWQRIEERIRTLQSLHLGHVARFETVRFLYPDREASPKEMHEETESYCGLETFAYHVRELVRVGVIELSRKSRVRGAVQHHYRLSDTARETLERIGGWS